MFDLQYLRRFLAVVEEMNMTRAAEKLHVAQPHMSRSIRMLESEIGFPLFDRTNRHRLELTSAGRVFLAGVTPLVAAYDEAIEAGRREHHAKRQRLTIAFMPVAMMGVLPPILQRFRNRHADMEIRLVDATAMPYQQLLEDIVCARVDVACGSFPSGAPEGVVHRRIRSAELRAVVPSSHPFSKRQAISVGELTEEPFVWVPPDVYPHLDACLMGLSEAEGRRPRILHVDPNTLNLVSYVESGLAVTVLSTIMQSFVRNRDVVFLPVANASFTTGVELMWLPGDRSSLVEELLLDSQTEAMLHPGTGL